MKVYCKNCKYLKPRKTALFCHPMDGRISTWREPRDKNYLMTEPCSERNGKNNCKCYRRIWWKFWIKG